MIRRRIKEPPPPKQGRAKTSDIPKRTYKKPKAKVVTFKQAARRLPNRVKNDRDKDGDVAPPKQGTRLGAGKTFLPDKVDQRSPRARRYRENFRDIVNDLGGPTYVTTLQRSVAKRAAAFIVMLEELELEWLLGTEQFDLDQYSELSRTMLMFSRTLGIRRIARPVNGVDIDVPPSLKDYVGRSSDTGA